MDVILVTGSSGTIGTGLCQTLLKNGHKVIGIDKVSNKWNKDVNKVTIIGDLLKKETFETNKAKLSNIKTVIHLAANARVYDLVVNPDLAFENFQTLFNTLEFARKNNVSNFIFASSRETYGNTSKEVLHEDEANHKHCESPYTASKLGGEALVHAYNKCYKLKTIILRFSNVYGMYDESNRFIPLVYKLAKNHKEIQIFGKDKVLDFTFIDDTVDGIIRAINNINQINGEVINIAYGKGISLLSVAEMMKEELDSKSPIVLKDNRTGEVVKYTADISKAKRLLNYEPKTDVEEGIKRSIDWCKQNLN